MKRLFPLFLIFIYFQKANADSWVYNRPEVGVGFSDNVYQDDFNKKSDTYAWLQFSSKYEAGDATWSGKLNINLYKTEYLNNYATYSLKRVSDLGSKTELTLGLGGLSYLKQDKGSTDESYNNFYLTGFVSKTIKEGSNYEIKVEPGTKFTTYPGLDRRFDATGYLGADVTWQTRTSTEIIPYAEVGFVFSNKAYYSRRYLALGVTWSEKLDDQYSFSFDYYMRNTVYPNRTVSDILYVPNRSGRATSRGFDIHESIGLRQISASITKSLLDSEITGGIIYAAENSLSDLEHYSENQVYASILFEL